MVRIWADEEILHCADRRSGCWVRREGHPGRPYHCGLSGMYERVGLLGGQLTIESAPGAGTCLTAELPLGQPAGHGEDE